MMSFIWGQKSYGKATPLFGIRTTNGVEGENNAFLYIDLRHQTVFDAILSFITKCSEVRGKINSKYQKLKEKNATVSEKAQKVIESEEKKCSHYEVLKVSSDSEMYNVLGSTTSTMVDLGEKTCDRCALRNQLCLPCRHLLAVLYR
jgi:hypothetical protein